MRARRLCHGDLSASSVVLSAEESHHATAVLRLGVGDEVILFDGVGREAAGRILRVARKSVEVGLRDVRSVPFELSCRLTLGVAMGRTHRQSYLVEKCTELGLAALWPIAGARSTARPDGSARARWKRRAIEAAKQSGRAWVPVIEGPRGLDDCLARSGEFESRLIADTVRDARPFRGVLAENREAKSMLVLVGPEGGWSDEERRQAADAGLVAVSLAPAVLRTETAAVAACAAVAMLFGALMREEGT